MADCVRLAHQLVGAREDEIGPGRERILGQGGMDGEMWAPRLVDDQRYPPHVRHLGEPPDVGDGAEVGRRDDHRRDRPRRVGQS